MRLQLALDLGTMSGNISGFMRINASSAFRATAIIENRIADLFIDTTIGAVNKVKVSSRIKKRVR